MRLYFQIDLNLDEPGVSQTINQPFEEGTRSHFANQKSCHHLTPKFIGKGTKVLSKLSIIQHHLQTELERRDSEVRLLKEKVKELEMFSKERSKAITHKNIQIA